MTRSNPKLKLPLAASVQGRGRQHMSLPADRTAMVRKLKGKRTYKELVTATGLGEVTIVLALTGQSTPTFKTGLALARALHISPFELLRQLEHLKSLPKKIPRWRINRRKAKWNFPGKPERRPW